ncbi:MAG: zinc-dependent alcohol dehydrogenase family protein [Bacteroidota bacterium]
MKAMVLHGVCDLRHTPEPLRLEELPDPVPQEDELLLKVDACGVCHTELDEIEGRTPPPRFPVVPGHQVVGRVEASGRRNRRFEKGERVGAAWIFSACGRCSFCLNGLENLCPDFKATGRDVNGGYAEYMTVPSMFAYKIPDTFTDAEAAPLLCAGAIGFRSLRLTGLADGQRLGLVGFGASAHLVLKMARHCFPRSEIFVFSRSNQERAFARELGAAWAGGIDDRPPDRLNSIIDTTPAWMPLVEAMKNLEPGGRLVINAIRKEETDRDHLRKLDYPHHLWLEKEIKSVANVTRSDVEEFLTLAATIPLKPEVQEFPLSKANVALGELRARKIRGGKVLLIR